VLAAFLAVTAVALTRSDSTGETASPQAEAPATSAPATTAAPAPDDTPRAGRRALVTVAVANVWKEPGVARPVDEPSVSNPVDIRRWVAAMSHDDKLWLVDRLVTQALYGERVDVQEIRDGWARVVVTGQPSHLDPKGYPGWIPAVQLRSGDLPDTARSAVVTRPTTVVRDADDRSRQLLELSFNTRLPALDAGAADVTVALPTGGRGVVAAAEVDVRPPGPRPVSGADLVRSAQLFSGLPYLWAGTSAAGFDCSGFTAAVYGVHGYVMPRDADDQAGEGTPVDRSRLQPGDLLFFSTGSDQRSIHHVSMYVGNGMMIQAPATGKTVETVPVDTPQYARQFWGARRYLPGGA
jgi:cell wall-associated NlpC family hydrolase